MRVLSGIQPTGRVHLGNYLGAIRGWVEDQYINESFFTLVDLHAITVEQEPRELFSATLELFATLIGAGLDPNTCTIFAQSQVNEHAALAWLLECTATFGELARMTQFKDKGHGSESVRAGLFTYPVLMAADILLYKAERVPVGEDQKQHLELTRDIAIRFNRLYGKVFTVPTPAIPKVAARVMDLQNPSKKMSKSSSTTLGLIYISDGADEIKRKISKAVTDTDNKVAYDPIGKPGISNLLEIFAAITGRAPDSIAEDYNSYGALKSDLTQLIVATLEPIAKRTKDLFDDRGELGRIMATGSGRAREIAANTLDSAKTAMGFVTATSTFK